MRTIIAEHKVEDSDYTIQIVRTPWLNVAGDRGAYWSIEIRKGGSGHSSQGARGEADARNLANGWYSYFYQLTHSGKPPFAYDGPIDVETFAALEAARLEADKLGSQ